MKRSSIDRKAEICKGVAKGLSSHSMAGVVPFKARVNKSRGCNGSFDGDEKRCPHKRVQWGIVDLHTHRCLSHPSASITLIGIDTVDRV